MSQKHVGIKVGDQYVMDCSKRGPPNGPRKVAVVIEDVDPDGDGTRIRVKYLDGTFYSGERQFTGLHLKSDFLAYLVHDPLNEMRKLIKEAKE